MSLQSRPQPLKNFSTLLLFIPFYSVVRTTSVLRFDMFIELLLLQKCSIQIKNPKGKEQVTLFIGIDTFINNVCLIKLKGFMVATASANK